MTERRYLSDEVREILAHEGLRIKSFGSIDTRLVTSALLEPADEPTDPSPSATGLCGNAEDYEEYTSALRAAFGEGMGDGAETSLTCEIERLSRLAEQAVAMRQHFGKAVWCLDGEGISEFLKAATGAPSATPLESPTILFKAAQFLNEAAWVERFKQSYAATGAPEDAPAPFFCHKLLELPACAAIRYGDIILAGKRHHDCLATIAKLNLPREAANAVNHGFMTTYGRFVNRNDARLLMERAKLESADSGGYRGDELFSEDLY